MRRIFVLNGEDEYHDHNVLALEFLRLSKRWCTILANLVRRSGRIYTPLLNSSICPRSPILKDLI